MITRARDELMIRAERAQLAQRKLKGAQMNTETRNTEKIRDIRNGEIRSGEIRGGF